MTKTGLFMVGRQFADGTKVKVRIELEFETPEQARDFARDMSAAKNDPLTTCNMILHQARAGQVYRHHDEERERIHRDGQDEVSRYAGSW